MSTPVNTSHNKVIPAKYRQVVLEALMHYPELKDVHIVFKLVNKYPVPYGTTPALSAYFSKPEGRVYVISILEEAKEPERHALFKHLPYEAQLGVLGHEFAHVLQFHGHSQRALIRTGLRFANFHKRRETERDADLKAIEHGLGRELYVHATYIRKIDGYMEKRHDLEVNYLKPHEILQAISQMQTGIGV